MMNSKFKEIMIQNGIAYAIVANIENKVIETFGDLKDLANSDLKDQLFYDIEKIKTLYDSLEGQIMPQSWKQGSTKCIIIKPSTNIIVGLIYNEKRKIAESIKFTKTINELIIDSWEK